MSKPKAMSRVMIDIETQVIQEISNLEEMILTEVPKLQEVRGEDDSTHLKVAASFFEPTQARYLFKKPLGKGASACVSLVQDVDIGRKVAIKEYKHRGDKGHRTCQKELQILGLLDHGGIPTIYDFGADEHKQYYCVMRYIEGLTLRDIITQLQRGDATTHSRFQFQDRADIIVQLLRIIGCAHDQEIIHRDIKPENIMVSSDGEVSLIDWGIAQKIERDITVENLVGTPSYMSPEQINLEDLDQRSDIYSIAVVFYELLSLYRTVPLQENVFSLLNAIRTAEIKLVDKLPHASQGYVPSEFKAIVHKGLASKKEDRYSSAEAMLLELLAMRNGDFCSICPRTTIKSVLYRFMQWLDLNPFINVPITILGLIATPILFVFLGVVLAKALM